MEQRQRRFLRKQGANVCAPSKLLFEQFEDRRLMAVVEAPDADGEFAVNTTTAGIEDSAQIAMDADGDFVVVWSERINGVFNVKSRRFDELAIAQGGETTVASSPYPPRIAMDSTGNHLVVYGRNTGLYGQLYNADGTPRGVEVQYTTYVVSHYDAAMDADGDFAVTWRAAFNDPLVGFETRVQLFDAAGNAKGADFPLSTGADSSITRPQVAMDGSGAFVVCYNQNTTLLFQRFDAAGNRLGVPVQVAAHAIPDRYDVAMATGGQFAVTYMNSTATNSGRGIAASRFDASGNLLEGPIQIDEAVNRTQVNPALSIDADGDIVVVWESEARTIRKDVYARRFKADGSVEYGEFRVNVTTADHQSWASVASDAAGNFVAVWTSINQDGDQQGVFAQRYQIAPDTTTVANPDAYTVDLNGMLTISRSMGLISNDVDIDGDDMTLATSWLDQAPLHGNLFLRDDGSFIYVPHRDFVGSDSFSYHLNEGNGVRTNTTVVSITVASTSGRSHFSASNVLVPAGAGSLSLANWALFQAGPGGPFTPSYTVNNVSNPAMFSVQPAVAADGRLTFAVAASQAGISTLDVTLNDGAGGTQTQTFLLIAGEDVLWPLSYSTLEGHSLQVAGDDAAVDLEIHGSSVAGEVYVTGSLGDFRALGVTGHLFVSLESGDDSLNVHNLFLGRNLIISMGAGNDNVQVGVDGIVSPAGSFAAFLQEGDDFLLCRNVYVVGTGSFEGGDGNDQIHLYDATAPGVFQLSYSSLNNSGIRAGAGDDEVIVEYAFVPHDITLDGGDGDDYIRIWGSAITWALNQFGRGGDDVLICDTNYLPGVSTIDAADGSDSILVANTLHEGGVVWLFAGAGSDAVNVRNVDAGQVRIYSGAQNDVVDVRSSLADILYAEFGANDDILTVYGNSVIGSLLLDGGDGFDRLLDLGNAFPISSSRNGFEGFS